MNRARSWARGAGWIAVLVLAALVAGQDQALGLMVGAPWLGSFVALVVLLALLGPGQMAMAVPAAALATLFGGVLFSTLPEVQGVSPLMLLLLGSGCAAVVAASLCLEGDTRVHSMAAGLVAGVLHVGFMHFLTVAPMASPFDLWPWAVPVMLMVWLSVSALL